MAYQDRNGNKFQKNGYSNNNGYNRGGKQFNNNDRQRSSKPIFKVLPIIINGHDRVGKEYNPDSLIKVLTDLQEADVFSKLSINLTIAKNLCIDGDNIKGVLSIARIQSFDIEHGEMSICLFGKNVEYADKITDMVIVPRIRTSRDSDAVSTILGFEIVPAMEA